MLPNAEDGLRSLGATIRATRIARGHTQQSLAKEAGVSRGNLMLLEKGRNVSVSYLLKIARVLDLKSIPLDGTIELTSGHRQGMNLFALLESLDLLTAVVDHLRGSVMNAALPVSERDEAKGALTLKEFVTRHLDDGARVERLAAAEGAQFGPSLLEHPPGEWREMMRGDERYRGYGTLKYLLEHARGKFETEPTFAFEIIAAVLDFVDGVRGPSRIHEIGLRGLAWKERANTCQQRGDLRAALTAAERSVQIYGTSPALLFEQTRAQLVICKIRRETGDIDRAMELARRCAEIFTDFGDPVYINMARMFEAGILYSSKRFTEALAIFTQLSEYAERSGDRLTHAQCLQCAAECARELGDLTTANDLYPRALALFELLNIPTDANCVRWGMARSAAAAGKVQYAVSELYEVRAVFLRLGMNSYAASAALDIVRIKFDADEDVRDLCAELVPLFANAGLTQNALEALAYLREQARSGRLTATTITNVKTYLDELAHTPELLFARARTEEA